jgi:hypothetical protein
MRDLVLLIVTVLVKVIAGRFGDQQGSVFDISELDALKNVERNVAIAAAEQRLLIATAKAKEAADDVTAAQHQLEDARAGYRAGAGIDIGMGFVAKHQELAQQHSTVDAAIISPAVSTTSALVTRTRIEDRMAQLERRHTTGLLRATVLRFSSMANFITLLADEHPVHVTVAGGSNTARGWPVELQQNMRATLPHHNVTVFNAAQGNTDTRSSYLALQQAVSSSSGLVIWEYAVNDDVSTASHTKVFDSNFEAWLTKVETLFPDASIGSVVLPNNNLHKFCKCHCQNKCHSKGFLCGTNLPESGLAEQRVDTILRGSHIGNQSFSVGLWNYMMKVGANKTGYDALWNPCTAHLHASGQKIVSDLVEYAIYSTALRVATGNEQQVAQSTDSNLPATSATSATSLGLLHEFPIQTTKVLSLQTPNFGSITGGASATLQCGGEHAQHLESLLLNGQGCIKPPPLPPDGPKCRVLDGRGANLILDSPGLCDNHLCPPCLALRGRLAPPRVDTKMALVIDDSVCCSLSEDHHITISRLNFSFKRLDRRDRIPAFVNITITHHMGEHGTPYTSLRMCKLSCMPGASTQNGSISRLIFMETSPIFSVP